ncbi:unnamed protein product [Discula destructiva]
MSLPGPAPANIVDIAVAELAIYFMLFGPTLWITWKHGKAGMTCWGIFVSVFGMRFASDINQIVHRDEPAVPSACSIVTMAGTLACLSMTLIGLVYEANIILPIPGHRWSQKAFLATTHLMNTTGIAMATYGGSPSHTGGVFSDPLNKTGNILMIIVMLIVCGWLWPSFKQVNAFSGRFNTRNSRYLLITACAAMPFQMARLIYNTTYAFDRNTSLDPVMGTFATQFVLLFLLHLVVVLISMAGGWLTQNTTDNRTFSDDGLNLEAQESVEGSKASAKASTALCE